MSNSANKLKQVRALQKNDNKSLQYIIDEAYRILGNPIILYDVDWKILAYPEGVVTDDHIWNTHINRGLKSNIYVAVADIGQCDPTYTKLDYYRDLFEQMRPDFKYAIYKNHIVLLMSSNSESLNLQKVLKELYDSFDHNNIYVSISTSFENLFEMPRYYAEAVKAINKNGEML